MVGHQLRRAELAVGKFRMLVYVAPPFNHLLQDQVGSPVDLLMQVRLGESGRKAEDDESLNQQFFQHGLNLPHPFLGFELRRPWSAVA